MFHYFSDVAEIIWLVAFNDDLMTFVADSGLVVYAIDSMDRL